MLENKVRYTAVAIIILLVGVIAYLWYLGWKKDSSPIAKTAEKNIASSTAAVARQSFEKEQEGLKRLLAEKTAEDRSLAGLDQATLKNKYTQANIRVSADSSVASLHAYGLKLAQILRPFSLERPNEVEILLKVLENSNSYEIDKIRASKDMNEGVIKALLATTVPWEIREYHLNLLNSLARDTVLLNNMSLVLDNPILALESADEYYKTHANFFNSIQELNKFLIGKGVTFKSDEVIVVYMNI